MVAKDNKLKPEMAIAESSGKTKVKTSPQKVEVKASPEKPIKVTTDLVVDLQIAFRSTKIDFNNTKMNQHNAYRNMPVVAVSKSPIRLPAKKLPSAAPE